jgi:hypothetical protein
MVYQSFIFAFGFGEHLGRLHYQKKVAPFLSANLSTKTLPFGYCVTSTSCASSQK